MAKQADAVVVPIPIAVRPAQAAIMLSISPRQIMAAHSQWRDSVCPS